MKDKNAIEKFVDRAMEDDDFQDVADVIEKSVESAIHYSKMGAGALMRGVKKGFGPKEPVRLPVNRDPAKVKQKVTAPNTWFWLRNAAGLSALSSFVCALMVFIDDIAYGVFSSDTIAAFLFLMISAVVFAAGTVVSQRNMILARDFFRIRREIQDQSVLATEDLVTALNKPQQTVAAEINHMIRKDYLPQARLVEGGDLLLIDHAAYKAYKDNYMGRTIPVKENVPEIEETEAPTDDDRATAMEDYEKTLKEQRDRAHDDVLKDKISALLKLLDAIRHAVNTDPGRVESLNKFVDYYTPTTIKLIERYLQFESSSVITDSIKNTMDDILRSLDKVIDGYEKLLDTLYKDDLLDLNAEMDVMETVMKQDGLIEESEGDEFHE